MRKDLNKQLCERERHLHDDHYANYRHMKVFKDDYLAELKDAGNDDDYDSRRVVSSGRREKMEIRYKVSGWGKSFNENLNPLWGAIRKNVGRKWDDIYGELCQVFDRRSVINQHILDHLGDRVAYKTKMVDGEILCISNYSGQLDRLADHWHEYYVHPETGVLLKNVNYETYRQQSRRRADQRKQEELAHRRIINETTELHLIDGLWYEVTFEIVGAVTENVKQQPYGKKHSYIQTRTVYPERYDVLKKKHVAERKAAISKRQLSHKEKKHHGLA